MCSCSGGVDRNALLRKGSPRGAYRTPGEALVFNLHRIRHLPFEPHVSAGLRDDRIVKSTDGIGHFATRGPNLNRPHAKACRAQKMGIVNFALVALSVPCGRPAPNTSGFTFYLEDNSSDAEGKL